MSLIHIGNAVIERKDYTFHVRRGSAVVEQCGTTLTMITGDKFTVDPDNGVVIRSGNSSYELCKGTVIATNCTFCDVGSNFVINGRQISIGDIEVNDNNVVVNSGTMCVRNGSKTVYMGPGGMYISKPGKTISMGPHGMVIKYT